MMLSTELIKNENILLPTLGMYISYISIVVSSVPLLIQKVIFVIILYLLLCSLVRKKNYNFEYIQEEF